MNETLVSFDKQYTLAIVGLGYVGLPLAVEFGKIMPTLGIDLSLEKVEACRRHVDLSGEVSSQDFQAATQLEYYTDPAVIEKADFIIIAVPTPLGLANQPDLSHLINASESVGKYLKRGAIVVYESTVYPGATENVCIPVLEKSSALKWKQIFGLVTVLNVLIPVTKSAPLLRLLKWFQVILLLHLIRWLRFMVA